MTLSMSQGNPVTIPAVLVTLRTLSCRFLHVRLSMIISGCIILPFERTSNYSQDNQVFFRSFLVSMISFLSKKDGSMIYSSVPLEIIHVEFINYILLWLFNKRGVLFAILRLLQYLKNLIEFIIILIIPVVELSIEYPSGCLGYPSRIDPMCLNKCMLNYPPRGLYGWFSTMTDYL